MESATESGSASTAAGEAAAVARSYFEAIDDHDMDRATSLWQTGARDEIFGIADLEAPGEIKGYFEALFGAAPDLSLKVESITADGDSAVVHWQMTGTFTGTGKVIGLAANGASVDLRGLDLITVREGKIVSNQAYTNGLVFARQLGVLPAEGSALERAMFAPFNLIAPVLRSFRRSRGARG